MQSISPRRKHPLRLVLTAISFTLLIGCGDEPPPTAVDGQHDLDLVSDEDGLKDEAPAENDNSIAPGEFNPGTPLVDVSALVAHLQAAGAESVVDDGERVAADFLPEARVIHLNGEPVSIYEFDSVEALKDVAGEISPTGYAIGTTQVMWISSPHFFARGNLLVLYVGVEESTLRLLLNILGTPIAGADLNIPIDDGPSTTPAPDDGVGVLGEPQLLVIDDEQQLSMVLDWIQDDELASRLQAVDLTREWIVIVARGQMPTAGYGITIENVSVNDEGIVVVEVSLTDPPIDALVAQSLTYPVDVSTVGHDVVPSAADTRWIATGGEDFLVGLSRWLTEPMPLPGIEEPVDDMSVDPEGSGTDDSLPPDAMIPEVDIHGKITQLELFDETTSSGIMARLLIEAKASDDTGYDRVWVEITSATRILRLMADTYVPATIQELTSAGSVDVHFTGPVRESYPVRAVAGQILILP